MQTINIGIIGGSGLYRMDGLENVSEHRIPTPYGEPSDTIVTGNLEGVPVAFLARHGRQHRFLPGEIPFRANVWAMKSLGVRYLLSVSAVGSLKEELAPRQMVLPDQFIDLTRGRAASFFGDGAVAHVALSHPVCSALADTVEAAFDEARLQGRVDTFLHRGGTYVCIEGPAFSTLAESRLYRSWDASVIGMTNMPEAKLAREAEIAYATLALVTDYDCWHPGHDAVTVDMAIANLLHNAANAQALICAVVRRLAERPPTSPAHRALDQAMITRPADMLPAVRERLAPLLEDYLRRN